MRSIHRPKRLCKKPHRFETTSSEEGVKVKKKSKYINEEKAKKKVSSTLQDIHNVMNNENVPCNSNFNKDSNCTRVRIMSDKTYQNTPYTLTYNQKHRLPYHPIPLTGQNVSNNTGQNATDNFTENAQQQTINNFQSFKANNATSISPQQSGINGNSFHHITQELNRNLMKNNIQHKEVSENITSSPIYPHSIPLENEMQLLHNLQPCCQPVSNVENANSLVQESYHIQELGNTVSIEPLQKVIPSHQIQLENNAPIAREKNEISQVIEILRDLQHKMQRTNERLNTIERKIDCNVINTIPTKPRILPFSTIEAIQMFTKDNAVYEEVVQYFKFLNCITLKDSVHQCIKEALTMQVAGQMTWWGINDIKFPFYNTILCQAIYQAVASNRYYPKPTREEFQKNIVASLKIAKQRFRNARGRHPGVQGNRRNLQATADALYNDDNDGDNRNSENDDNDRDNRNSENEYNVTDVENDSDENEHSSNDS